MKKKIFQPCSNNDNIVVSVSHYSKSKLTGMMCKAELLPALNTVPRRGGGKEMTG